MVAMREANDILIARHSEQIYNLGIKPFPLSQPAVAVTRAFGAHAPFKLVGPPASLLGCLFQAHKGSFVSLAGWTA